MHISLVDGEVLERAAVSGKSALKKGQKIHQLDPVSPLMPDARCQGKSSWTAVAKVFTSLVALEEYIEPGAGLFSPEDVQDSDFIFDSIFQHGNNALMPDIEISGPSSPLVRTYQSDRDM